MRAFFARCRPIRVASIGLLIMVVALGGWWVFVRNSTREADVSHQRAIFSHFAVYPGASLVHEEVDELQADGRGLGHYGVRTVYRLPA